MSRLALGNMMGRSPIDREFAELEAEIMAGSEVDYDIGAQNVPDMDIASDIQEQSVGNLTPSMPHAVCRHLCHTWEYRI